MDAVTEPPAREAILFLPGIGRRWGPRSLGIVARRLARELDRNAATPTARFGVTFPAEEQAPAGENGETPRLVTIFRADGGHAVPVIDVYELTYASALRDGYERASPASRALLATLALLTGFGRLLRSLTHPTRGTRGRQRAQLVYGFSVLLLLSAYLIILLVAAAETLTRLPSYFGGRPTATVAQAIAVLGSAILWLRPGARQAIAEAAINYVSALSYLSYGVGGQAVRGRFADLLERIGEAGKGYAAVHVFAYSFGSIVALDALFPPDGRVSARFAMVDALVTLGCPFDVVRTFWPGYFEGRAKPAHAPKRWCNVYSPVDALSSNFRDSRETAGLEAEVGVAGARPTNLLHPGSGSMRLGAVGLLGLMGLRYHTMYWNERDEASITSFAPVVLQVYGTAHPLLR
jgi:hypothetical protein